MYTACDGPNHNSEKSSHPESLWSSMRSRSVRELLAMLTPMSACRSVLNRKGGMNWMFPRMNSGSNSSSRRLPNTGWVIRGRSEGRDKPWEWWGELLRLLEPMVWSGGKLHPRGCSLYFKTNLCNFLHQVSPFVGAGSDHASFLFYAGVPVMDIFFVEVVAWNC